jgi:hypothetical protein
MALLKYTYHRIYLILRRVGFPEIAENAWVFLIAPLTITLVLVTCIYQHWCGSIFSNFYVAPYSIGFGFALVAAIFSVADPIERTMKAKSDDEFFTAHPILKNNGTFLFVTYMTMPVWSSLCLVFIFKYIIG